MIAGIENLKDESARQKDRRTRRYRVREQEERRNIAKIRRIHRAGDPFAGSSKRGRAQAVRNEKISSPFSADFL